MLLQELPLDVREAIIDRILRALQTLVVDGVQNLILDDEVLCKMRSLGIIEIERRELGDVYLFTEEVQRLLVDIIDDAIGEC